MKKNTKMVAGGFTRYRQRHYQISCGLLAGVFTFRRIYHYQKLYLSTDILRLTDKKCPKSLGNVADPLEFVEKYGADGLRYYLL